MTDPYRIIDPQGSRERTSTTAGVTRVGVLRSLTWVVLVISAVGNTVSSAGGAGTLVNLGFGLVTALCVVVLVTQYVQSHR